MLALQLESSAALLRASFTTATGLRRLLLATSKELGRSETGLAGAFTRVSASTEAGVLLYEAARDLVLPPLSIRRAKVEDHDDMLPVLERSDAR